MSFGYSMKTAASNQASRRPILSGAMKEPLPSKHKGPISSSGSKPQDKGTKSSRNQHANSLASIENTPKSSSYTSPSTYTTYSGRMSPRTHRRTNGLGVDKHQQTPPAVLPSESPVGDKYSSTNMRSNSLPFERSRTPTLNRKAQDMTAGSLLSWSESSQRRPSTPEREREIKITNYLSSHQPETDIVGSSQSRMLTRRVSSPKSGHLPQLDTTASEYRSLTGAISGQGTISSSIHFSKDSCFPSASPPILNESTRKNNVNFNNSVLSSPPPTTTLNDHKGITEHSLGMYEHQSSLHTAARGHVHQDQSPVRSTTSSSSFIAHTDLDVQSNSFTKPFINSTQPVLVGLRNLGNTCYMNSILQCLSVTEKLRDVLSGEKEVVRKAKKQSRSLVKGFADLLQQMSAKENDGSSVAPTLFKQRIQRLAPQFQGYSQHDSQEFLRFLLNGLHEELNTAHPSKDKSLSPSPRHTGNSIMADRAWRQTLAFDNSEVSSIFMGQLRSVLKCLTCGNESVTFDPFWDLSLPIPKSTVPSSSSRSSIYGSSGSNSSGVLLEDCFKLFIKEEKLDYDNKPICEKCQSLQPSTKQLSIHRYPEVLVIHLKRFSGVHFRTKLATNVLFNEELTPPTSSDEGVPLVRYQLYAISNHSGSCYGGHYTAYCKHPSSQRRWYMFNDSSVTSLSGKSVQSPQAYVLFYKKLD